MGPPYITEFLAMTSTTPHAAARPDAKPGRLLHTLTSVFLILLVVAGFHHFYLEGRAYPGRDIPPPIRSLVIAHGAAMALWMILLVVQSALIAARRHKVHMTLGMLGTVLAAAIVVLGWNLGVESARIAPPEMRIWGLSPADFMAVPVVSVVLFGGFVAIGVAARKKPQIHRAMMMLATFAALSAAVSRIDALNDLYLGTFWERAFGPFFTTLVLAALFLVVKRFVTGAWDKTYAAGLAVLVVADWAIVQAAPTKLWGGIASALLG